MTPDVEPPPNILFVLFDKCRRDAIGAYGLRDVRTPRIDELARSGALFTTCYTPQSLCGPARASILTGRHPHTHGLCRNVYPHTEWAGHPNVFPEAIPDPFADGQFRLWDNVAFFLHNAGYRTAHIGKWHLGMGNPGFFDVWRSFNSGLPHWVGTPHASAWRPDVHTDHGVEFIAENRDRWERRVEQLNDELAKAIKAEPAKAGELLKAAGMDEATFRQKLFDIAADAKKSAAYSKLTE